MPDIDRDVAATADDAVSEDGHASAHGVGDPGKRVDRRRRAIHVPARAR